MIVDELSHENIDCVLEHVHDYCSSRLDCEGCRYGYILTPDRLFMDCAFITIPSHWKIDKIGGEKNGLSDANNSKDQ